MGHRTFVRIAYAFVVLLPFASPVFAADQANVSGPVVYANLAIYFVHKASAESAGPLTLEDAIAKGQLRVRERGDVNELAVENIGRDEVFIQTGDIVKGGLQDRVLSMDLLLPAHSGEVPIAAFCIEPGRWSQRGEESAAQFTGPDAAMPSHDAMLVMRSVVSSAGGADPGQNQAQIWASVRKKQQTLAQAIGAPVAAVVSPSSLQLSLESHELKEALAPYISALQGGAESEDDIVGYFFAINGKIRSGDVYASKALFRKLWAKMLDANATEAISEKDSAGAGPPPVKDVEAFLASAERAPEAKRKVSANVDLAIRDGEGSFYAETRRADGSWVHRNYLAK